VTSALDLAARLTIAMGLALSAAWFYGSPLTEHELAAGLCALTCGALIAALRVRHDAEASR
jgi:hypothetical protein